MECVQRVSKLFVESLCPSTLVTARMGDLQEGEFITGVPETHFQRVYAMLESGSWTAMSNDSILRVQYKLPASHQDSNQSPVKLAYIKDSSSVFCYRSVESDPVYWMSDERGIMIQVKTTRSVAAQPPEAGSRYDTVSISLFREYKRSSSAAAGITWVYRLTVTWKADCVRSAYMALPVHHIDITMERDPSLPQYVPATTQNMQMSLAGSMYSKCLDLLIQPATLRLSCEYDNDDDDAASCMST
jgi:hypothetical protein